MNLWEKGRRILASWGNASTALVAELLSLALCLVATSNLLSWSLLQCGWWREDRNVPFFSWGSAEMRNTGSRSLKWPVTLQPSDQMTRVCARAGVSAGAVQPFSLLHHLDSWGASLLLKSSFGVKPSSSWMRSLKLGVTEPGSALTCCTASSAAWACWVLGNALPLHCCDSGTSWFGSPKELLLPWMLDCHA